MAAQALYNKKQPLAYPAIDVAINIFAKPYQTSLSMLSLLRFSRQHIDTIYLQFEPYGSEHDTALPYVIFEYLQNLKNAPKLITYQPDHWLKLEAPELPRMTEDNYRWGIRYQYAFEHSTAKYLFVMHNDILFYKDILGIFKAAFEPNIFAVGTVGQCWNCPARRADLLKEAQINTTPCQPNNYADFRLTFNELVNLYQTAHKKGVFVRPYWEGWKYKYLEEAWPLPECRVNEWACLIDLELTQQHIFPKGDILPFGAYEPCGTIALDIGVAWFRELNRRGFRARHINDKGIFKHWVGTGKVMRSKYLQAEDNARHILEKHFPEFFSWCKAKNNGLFSKIQSQ